jgi:hypothetical protein
VNHGNPDCDLPAKLPQASASEHHDEGSRRPEWAQSSHVVVSAKADDPVSAAIFGIADMPVLGTVAKWL